VLDLRQTGGGKRSTFFKKGGREKKIVPSPERVATLEKFGRSFVRFIMLKKEKTYPGWKKFYFAKRREKSK